MGEPIAIVAVGMVCPVGLNADAACAAMRAGVSNFQSLPFLDNSSEAISGAWFPELNHLAYHKRLLEMLTPAIIECLKMNEMGRLGTIPVLIGLCEEGRPGTTRDSLHSITRLLQDRTGIEFHRGLSALIRGGRTSVFQALARARELFAQNAAQACLVCAVDSLINARVLHWLDQRWGLKTMENSDGVIPGEAAAVLLLQSKNTSWPRRAVEVAGLGFAHEPAAVLPEEPMLGIAMASAARRALAEAGLEMHEMDFRVSDVSGEGYAFKEQSLCVARCLRRRKEQFPLWHIADSIGDTGAAAGACGIVSTFMAFKKHYAPGRHAICFGSAHEGPRAVAVLRFEDSPEGL